VVYIPCVGHDAKKTLPFFLTCGALRRVPFVLAEIHSGDRGQSFEGFRKVQTMKLHEKRDDRSAFGAAEAMIKLFLLADVERRTFFFVEGADPQIVAT